MTAKQMTRAIKRYNISLIFNRITNLWYAGESYLRDAGTDTFGIKTKHRGSQHVGHEPELVVEDYCNARNLEWDV
jgi:hypothetical protein